MYLSPGIHLKNILNVIYYYYFQLAIGLCALTREKERGKVRKQATGSRIQTIVSPLGVQSLHHNATAGPYYFNVCMSEWMSDRKFFQGIKMC